MFVSRIFILFLIKCYLFNSKMHHIASCKKKICSEFSSMLTIKSSWFPPASCFQPFLSIADQNLQKQKCSIRLPGDPPDSVYPANNICFLCFCHLLHYGPVVSAQPQIIAASCPFYLFSCFFVRQSPLNIEGSTRLFYRHASLYHVASVRFKQVYQHQS